MCIVKTNRSLQRLCFNEKSVTKQHPCLKLLLHESYNLSAYNTMAFPIYFQNNIWSINIVLPSVTASSFNTATPSLCPCSSRGEHSQPTTDYPNITATAGPTTDYPDTTATARPTTDYTDTTATAGAGNLWLANSFELIFTLYLKPKKRLCIITTTSIVICVVVAAGSYSTL